MLEKFEFKVHRADLSSTPNWLYQTLWSINSPTFKKFIISVSNCSSAANLRAAMNGGGWGSFDAYIYVLIKSQSSFRVLFRVGFGDNEEYVVINLLRERFPLASNEGILKVERVL